MKRMWMSLAVCCLALGLGGRARADTFVEYLGPHPVDPGLTKGMCYIEGPHVHAYAPHDKVLYVEVDDGWAFVGDPTEFERGAPKYGYYGHHPVFWIEGEVEAPAHYCYITGPHYHWYAPPPKLKFKRKGGVYWYVGKHPDWYQARAHKHLDEHYVAVHLVHPVVTVAPPVGFIGVVVAAPSVHVAVPLPGFGVVFGAPAPHGKVKFKHGKHGGPRPHAPAWGRRGYKGKGKWK